MKTSKNDLCICGDTRAVHYRRKNNIYFCIACNCTYYKTKASDRAGKLAHTDVGANPTTPRKAELVSPAPEKPCKHEWVMAGSRTGQNIWEKCDKCGVIEKPHQDGKSIAECGCPSCDKIFLADYTATTPREARDWCECDRCGWEGFTEKQCSEMIKICKKCQEKPTTHKFMQQSKKMER